MVPKNLEPLFGINAKGGIKRALLCHRHGWVLLLKYFRLSWTGRPRAVVTLLKRPPVPPPNCPDSFDRFVIFRTQKNW